jgi:hypothetical protein
LFALAVTISLVLAQGSTTLAGPAVADIVTESAAVPDDFFTYLLSAPALGSQCTDAALVSDQADAITCTRASTAYCTKADGTMVLHSNNRCRVEEHGVLMEAPKTNLTLRSQEMGNAAWTALGSTVTSNTVAAPDGTTTAETVTLSAGAGQHLIYNGNTETAATWTKSVFLKAGTVSFGGLSPINTNAQYVVADLSNCTVASSAGAISTAAVALANGWCRLAITYTSSVATKYATVHLGDTAARAVGGASWTALGTETVYAWGAQSELGTFASSYIPTVGTAVARLRDLLYTTLTQSVDAAGCFAATVRHGTVFNGINGWISTDQVGLYAGSATTIEAVTSAGGASITVPSLLSTSTTARAWWDATVTGVESGGTSDTSSGGTMSSDSIISFGDYLDGHVRGIRVNTNIGGCQ